MSSANRLTWHEGGTRNVLLLETARNGLVLRSAAMRSMLFRLRARNVDRRGRQSHSGNLDDRTVSVFLPISWPS